MKFGKHLHKIKHPLWANYYLDYNGLKREIKLFRVKSSTSGEALDCTSILERIDREINIVQEFYLKVFNDIGAVMSKFCKRSNLLDQELNWEHADRQELHFLFSLLTQYHTNLRNLLLYGTVNSKGFYRLLQKVNMLLRSRCESSSKMIATTVHGKDIQSRLSKMDFSVQQNCLYEMNLVNGSMQAISQVLSRNSFISQSSLFLNSFGRHGCSAAGNLDAAYRAIRDDNVAALDYFLQDVVNTFTADKLNNETVVLSLLQLSIIRISKTCFYRLFVLLMSNHEDKAATQIYFSLAIIQILVVMGHRKLITDSVDQNSECIADSKTTGECDDNLLSLLNILLQELDPKNVQAILITPGPLCKRLPIHYAVEYGLTQACRLLLSRMKGVTTSGDLSAHESVLFQSSPETCPLRLAIINGNDEIVRLLLDCKANNKGPLGQQWKQFLGSLLGDAVGSNRTILLMLLDSDPNVNYQGRYRETALYIAARCGDVESVRLLLSHGANVDIAESSYGWTPLIVASAQGHTQVVECLLDVGASLEYRDESGWTAVEHAAFSGRITIARKLKGLARAECQTYSLCTNHNLGQGSYSFRPREAVRLIQPLASDNQVLINLSSVELEDISTTSWCDRKLYFSKSKPGAESEVGFSIQISLIGGHGSPTYNVDLPILEDLTNKPWCFYTNDLKNAKLMFRIYSKTANADKIVVYDHVGSGIALLGTLKQGLGHEKESLVRHHTIPILSKESLQSMGLVSFNMLVVKPLTKQTKYSVPPRDVLWKDARRTKVIGHRGLGQNISSPRHLSIGENTLQSFLTASNIGADWVELDVQLTKDLVPVVYHDFLVSETGTDAWMHNLSLEQFMHISHTQSAVSRRDTGLYYRQRSRSLSFNDACGKHANDLTARMTHTFEYKKVGFKGNTRGNYIHGSFLTLHELLSQTPDSMALNIEIKYPMLSEAAEDWKSDTFAIEVNTFVDTILTSILSHPSCQRRPIMLSSFNPEVCILVSLKQRKFPIFFLNDSGNTPVGDIRASSLQEAIHFATNWGLDGTIVASEPFVYAPNLVGVAKTKGLVIGSYGALNNEPECAMIQQAAGLDIIIVDAVCLISSTLKAASL